MEQRHPTQLLAILAAFCALVIAVVAPLAGVRAGQNNPATVAQANPALFAMLPPSIQSSKTLAVAAGNDYPPLEYVDAGGTFKGFEVDLVRAISAKLGVTPQFSGISFDALIPSVAGDRFNLAVFGVLDKAVRHATVSFVDDLNTSISIVMRKDDPRLGKVKTIDDLCGLTAGAGSGESELTMLEDASTHCTSSGKAAISVQVFTSASDEHLSLTSGRINAILGGTPGLVHFVDITPGIQLAGKPFNFRPYGIVLNKDQAGLINAVRQAEQSLMDDGTYKKLLIQYNLSDNGLQQAAINAGK